MAKTFIGELILRLKDEMSGKAKEAASNLDTSVERIQRAAQKMNQTSWGGAFEEKLRKLGASSSDIDKLRTSWENLNKTLAEKDISKAAQAMEKANFKNASLGVFAELATKADTAESSITRMHNSMKDAMKDMVVWSTTGALLYGGVEAFRGGVKANAEFQKELFAQQNAKIPIGDQARILAESDRLTTQYPSAGLVNAMMMARSARAMMGDTERGLAILPDMVKGLVALQSAKNPDVAVTQLQNLLRGIDNAGKNQNGELGVENTRQIVAGMIRAAQIEGGDIDPGKFFDFARAGKIAVPGLSTEFLATIQPALSQDMKPESFGKALSSAYQAFVIGSNAVTNKDNMSRQREIGIREGDEDGGKGHLVQDKLFGTNPYQWVKQVLIPALAKSGTDMNDPVAIGKDIAKLSRNQNVSGLLTRMVTQQQQTDRLIEQYRNAVGPDAADAATAKDPFVAWKGFVESWRELATAIKGMPEAVAGLNMLTSGLQRFATALRNDSGLAQLTLAGAGAAGVFGAWKMAAGLWSLTTAGPALTAAAASLEAAAVSLGAAGAIGDVPGKAGKAGLWGKALEYGGGLMPWLSSLAKGVSVPTTAAVITYKALENTPHAGMESALRDNPNLLIELENDRRRWQGIAFESGRHRAGLGAGPKPGSDVVAPRLVNPYQSALEYMDRRQEMENLTNPQNGLDLKHEIAAIVYELMKPTRDRLFAEIPADKGKQADQTTTAAVPRNIDLDARAAEEDQRREQMRDLTTPYDPNTPNISQYFEQPAAEQKPIVIEHQATDARTAAAYQQNADTRQAAGVSSNPQVKPEVDMSAIDAAAAAAQAVGQQIIQGLAVTGSPQVNLSALQQALSMVNAINAGLSRMSGAVQQAHASVGHEMRRNFADYGVSP